MFDNANPSLPSVDCVGSGFRRFKPNTLFFFKGQGVLRAHNPCIMLWFRCLNSFRLSTLHFSSSLSLPSFLNTVHVFDEDSGTLADNHRFTYYESNEYKESSDKKLLFFISWRMLFSPLFTQERKDPAGREQAQHSHEERLLPTQSLSFGHFKTWKCVFNEFGSLFSNDRKCRDSENEQIRIFLEREKEQTMPIATGMQIRRWNCRNSTKWKLSFFSRRWTMTRSKNFFMNICWNKIGVFVSKNWNLKTQHSGSKCNLRTLTEHRNCKMKFTVNTNEVYC